MPSPQMDIFGKFQIPIQKIEETEYEKNIRLVKYFQMKFDKLLAKNGKLILVDKISRTAISIE
jgi:hypothetical protein